VSGTAELAVRAERFRALFGHQADFRAWYDVAFPIVYSYLRARCPTGTVAADLAQEAFIEAVRHRDGFDGRSEPTTWLVGIARHKLADHFRRLDREERRNLRLAEEGMEGAGPIGNVEEREAVERALESLPAMQRAALTLHYLDGLSVREIAGILERSDEAVESLLARARQRFRLAYGPALEVDRG